jgi:lipoprotein-anchoring transpeptidase ErfK/SrfK
MNRWLHMALLFPVLPALGAAPAATRAPATSDPLAVAALQAALDRAGFGAGFVDGKDGPRTRQAFLDYRRAKGQSERKARAALLSNDVPATVTYTITEDDCNLVGTAPEDWMEASDVPRMAFVSLDEALSERFHVSRPFLNRLNPGVMEWTRSMAGASIVVPNTGMGLGLAPAARIEIDCAAFRLRAFNSNAMMMASFPCSVARDLARVPTGELCIASFAPNPNYTFDPANFPVSARAQAIGHKLILPPGPNNPVGVYWITLNAPGFGIHGTPHPETIGGRESHGCFRLTNWDIVTLAGMVQVGTPVSVIGVPVPVTPPQEQ